MRVDDLQAELRARTPWEAVDLGFAMARRWWRPLWAAWGALVVPVQALIFVLLWGHPILAALLTWYLLPLWERVALFVLSRCLFGVQPGVGQVARELRATLWAGLLGDLLVRRLSPWRTVVLPVSQLEHLSGYRATQRRRVLGEQVGGTGAAVAFAAALVELCLGAGLVVLTTWVLPDSPAWSLEVLLDEVLDGAWWGTPALGAPLLAVVALVQPLRTGACFGLYLQRRTVLEGWDVELTFRRLAERLARRAAGAAVLLLGLGLLASGPALAQDPVPDEQVREVTAEVMADPVFGGTRTVSRWRFRFEPPDLDGPGLDRGPALSLGPLAGAIQWLLAAVVGVAVVGLLVSLLSRAPPRLEGPTGALLPPSEVRAGLLDLDGRALPEHPAEAAWALWQQGQQEAAMGLLYRAAVAHLVHRRHLEIDDSATEGDCVRAARRSLPARPAAYLVQLTRAWQRLAYGHRPVEDHEMRALVEAWGELDAGAL